MLLKADKLHVSLGGRRIVQDVSLRLQAGELVGLIGPNGAGKSTLLRALLGLYPVQHGEVMLDTRALSALSSRERARALAYLPQSRQVQWQLPCRDVVMLGRVPYRGAFARPGAHCERAVDEALAAVDANDLAHRSIDTLSGGERSRVLLARALAVQAPLLLVDEPTADLDPYHQLHVMEILQGSTRTGTGVLAVLHDLSLASRFMDRVLLMHHGCLVAEGPPAEVLNPARLAEVYNIQAFAGDHDGARFIVPWRRGAE